MKNLTEFKKYLKENVGKTITVTNHIPPFPGDKEYRGVKTNRTIGKVQTNGFYTEFLDSQDKLRNVWVEFPKAKHVNVLGNKIEFLTHEVKNSRGETYIFPDNTMELNVPWLVIQDL